MKIKILLLLFLPAFFLLILNSTAMAGKDINSIFQEAGKAYSEGNYEAAADGYRALIGEGVDSAEVRSNLGDALFREGKLGEAVFQLMIAHKLEPRNADIEYNLNYVRNRITDKIEKIKPNLAARPFYFFEGKLSVSDSWTLFAVLSLLFWSSAIIFLFIRKDWLKWLVICFGIVFIFQSAILIKKEIFTRPFGVVTAEEAPVYSAPGENNVLLFNLHEGTDFQVLNRREGDWLQIRLSDGKKGWISKTLIVSED